MPSLCRPSHRNLQLHPLALTRARTRLLAVHRRVQQPTPGQADAPVRRSHVVRPCPARDRRPDRKIPLRICRTRSYPAQIETIPGLDVSDFSGHPRSRALRHSDLTATGHERGDRHPGSICRPRRPEPRCARGRERLQSSYRPELRLPDAPGLRDRPARPTPAARPAQRMWRRSLESHPATPPRIWRKLSALGFRNGKFPTFGHPGPPLEPLPDGAPEAAISAGLRNAAIVPLRRPGWTRRRTGTLSIFGRVDRSRIQNVA